MQRKLSTVLWRLAAFVTVCFLGAFALIAIFAQLRFQDEATYNAVFTSVTGLEDGDFVRIAGVEVGKVGKVTIQDDSTALVSFGADDSVMITDGTKAVIRYDDLIGGRYLALEEGAGGLNRLSPGSTIPVERTAPALDLDALIGGFRPLFRALDPDQVNALSSQLIAAFQGQGPSIGSILGEAAALTSTLADRDELIGELVVNLDSVMASLGDRSDQFGEALDSLSGLVDGLDARRGEVSSAVAYANDTAGTVADLLAQTRPSLQKVVHETDRTAGNVLMDHEYFDGFIERLPHAYQILGRQALNGDFFSFYLCDIVMKVNGKGGQPVYVKLVGQSSGRCTPQ